MPKSSSAAARLAVRHFSINAMRSSSLEDVARVWAWVSICISLRSCIISRAAEGLEGVLLAASREGVEFGRGTRVFGALNAECLCADATFPEGDGVAFCPALFVECAELAQTESSSNISLADDSEDGGSEDGGSSPMLGFNGVRKGDLNGLCSVFAASFSRRRFACGVDMSAILYTFESPIKSTIAE